MPQQNGATYESQAISSSIEEGGGKSDHIGMALKDIRFPRLHRYLDGTVDVFKAVSLPQGRASNDSAKGMSVSVDGPSSFFVIQRKEANL